MPDPIETTDGSSLEGAHVLVGHVMAASARTPRRLDVLGVRLAKVPIGRPASCMSKARLRHDAEVPASAMHVEPDARMRIWGAPPSVIVFWDLSKVLKGTSCAG